MGACHLSVRAQLLSILSQHQFPTLIPVFLYPDADAPWSEDDIKSRCIPVFVVESWLQSPAGERVAELTIKELRAVTAGQFWCILANDLSWDQATALVKDFSVLPSDGSFWKDILELRYVFKDSVDHSRAYSVDNLFDVNFFFPGKVTMKVKFSARN